MRPANSLEVHAVRVLLLIDAFEEIDGLSTLAKLDFLARYPTLLFRLAEIRGLEVDASVGPSESEASAIESLMVRYKYGPWGDRYAPIVGMLAGLGLISTRASEGQISLRMTPSGRSVAQRVAGSGLWSDSAARCAYLAKNFDLSELELKSLIYENLPTVTELQWHHGKDY